MAKIIAIKPVVILSAEESSVFIEPSFAICDDVPEIEVTRNSINDLPVTIISYILLNMVGSTLDQLHV